MRDTRRTPVLLGARGLLLGAQLGYVYRCGLGHRRRALLDKVAVLDERLLDHAQLCLAAARAGALDACESVISAHLCAIEATHGGRGHA